MSDKELDQLYEKTGERMATLARRKISADNNPSISSRKKEKTQRDYYQAQRIYNDLRNERDKRADQRRMKRKASQGSPRKVVNGFGEATNRYITTATYERARKRREKEALGVFMGLR